VTTDSRLGMHRPHTRPLTGLSASTTSHRSRPGPAWAWARDERTRALGERWHAQRSSYVRVPVGGAQLNTLIGHGRDLRPCKYRIVELYAAGGLASCWPWQQARGTTLYRLPAFGRLPGDDGDHAAQRRGSGRADSLCVLALGRAPCWAKRPQQSYRLTIW